MSTQFDPTRYKAGQQKEWGAAAPGWKDWGHVIGPELQPISDRMMELAEIRPGQQVLDVATGLGEPAVTAAHLVGPSGRVIAIDIAPQMLDIARMRVNELGLHNIDFREMDAEELDLPEQSFDVILCRLGLMYLPNLQTSLERMRNLLVPGGRVTAAVWGPAQKVPFVSMPMAVAMRELQVPPPPGMPGPFSLADTDRVAQVLTQAGFTQVYTEPMTLTLDWTSIDEYVRFLQEVLVQIDALLARYPVERQAEVWRAIAKAAQQFITPDGTCRTENELILIVGRRGMEDNLL
jgi:SAM-dependent methyltransferase